MAGFKSYHNYSVLGDDLVIHNKEVAQNYEHLMSLIGVKINRAKSVVADGDSNKRSEFAKRTFYNGIELSGLRYDIVNSAGSSLLMIPDLLRVAKLRSFELDATRFWPPALSDKGRVLLNILISYYNKAWAPLQGNPCPSFDIETLYREVLRLRINRLKENADSVNSVMMDNKPIESLFSRGE